MSVERIAEALRLNDMTPTEKLVLIGIANHDGDGGAWPATSTLAVYAMCEPRTVRRAVAALVAKGLVTVHVNQGGNAKTRDDRRPNLYTLHLDGGTAESTRDGWTETDERVDIPEAAGGPGKPERVDVTVSTEPSLNRPCKEPSLVESRASLEVADGRFDRFWQLYPRKTAKPLAAKAFDRALKRADFDTIMLGLEPWLVYWRARNEPEFVPHPATWLNQDRWNDTPTHPRGRQNGKPSSVSAFLDSHEAEIAGVLPGDSHFGDGFAS